MGAWLALVALVLQVGLSFGHVHGPAPDHALEVTSVNPDGSKDADPDHGDDHNYCPSCAFLRLLAGAQIGAISASPLPVWQAAEHVIQAVETTRPGNTQALFRARAPPLA